MSFKQELQSTTFDNDGDDADGKNDVVISSSEWLQFKDKNIDTWTAKDLQDWITSLSLDDIGITLKLHQMIEELNLNGYDFNKYKNGQEISDKLQIGIVIGNTLYNHLPKLRVDDDGDAILDDLQKNDKCLSSWNGNDLIQWVETLNFAQESKELLIRKIYINKINGFKVNKCNDAKDVANLFEIDQEGGKALFDDIKREKTIWDKNVLEWNTNDVTNWISSLGPNMTQCIPDFSNWKVTGLQLMLLFVDSNPYAFHLNFILSSPLFMTNLEKLRKKYNVTDQELKTKKQKSQFGLIGLKRHQNTCFMNTAIQLILQTPGIYQQLNINIDNNDNEDICDGKQYRKCDPRRMFSNTKGVDNNSMIDCFIDLHNKSMKHEYNSTKPTAIFNRICQIDSKYKTKDQQDSAAVMSLILQDMDQDLNNHFLNQNDDEKDDNMKIPFTSTIAVKQLLSKQQEQTIIHERLLKKHNPYNTTIRKVMDGVQRIILTCLDCNYKRVEYETFRTIKLPLITNEKSINVKIYTPNQKQPIIQVFNVESYTKIYVLKHQIAQLISDQSYINNISIDNVIIGSIIPTNYNNSDCVDNWIRFYDANEKCSELSRAINLFATIQQNPNSKLITIFDVKIDRNERIIHDECRFVEMAPNSTWKGSDLLHLTVGDQHNKNNICISLQNRIIDIMDDTKYTIGSKTNALILIEMENDKLRSKCFPSLAEFRRNNGAEQMVIEECINRYNRENQENIKHISLNVMINHLRENLNIKSNSNWYNKLLRNVLTIAETQNVSKNNIIKYLRKSLSMNNKNVRNKPILDDIDDCLKEYEREKILDHDCSQMFCKKCRKNPKIFKEQISIVYSPKNLTFRIERGNDKQTYNDKFNHLVKYPFQNALVLSNENKYNLYGVAVHDSLNTLKSGHYYAYIKSIYSDQWHEINESSVRRIGSNSNKIQNQQAIILMYTKSE